MNSCNFKIRDESRSSVQKSDVEKLEKKLHDLQIEVSALKKLVIFLVVYFFVQNFMPFQSSEMTWVYQCICAFQELPNRIIIAMSRSRSNSVTIKWQNLLAFFAVFLSPLQYVRVQVNLLTLGLRTEMTSKNVLKFCLIYVTLFAND